MSEQKTVEKEKKEAKKKEEKVVEAKVVEKAFSKEEIVGKVVLEHYGTLVLHDIDETAKIEDATVIVPTDRTIKHEGEDVPVVHAISAREENLEKVKKILSGKFAMEGHVVKVLPEKMPILIDNFSVVLEGLKKVEKIIVAELEKKDVEKKVEKEIEEKTEGVGI